MSVGRPEGELYAHTLEGRPESEWQTLGDHLSGVAALAESFSRELGLEGWGRAVGCLHDAGKVNPAFQARLHGSRARVDHASLGACIARSAYSGTSVPGFGGTLMSYALAGHHTGLPNGTGRHGSPHRPLCERLDELRSSQDYEHLCSAYDRALREAGCELPAVGDLASLPIERIYRACATKGSSEADAKRAIFSVSVTTRMLFSALVDADYLDTERFVTPEASRRRSSGSVGDLGILVRRLDAHLDSLVSSAPDTPVNRARARVLRDCRAAADGAPGVYALDVPTGGGKTLAGMDFALRHAVRNGMRRVIYAAPFTSIIEQTASVYRSVLGEGSVLEHHSNCDYSDLEDESTAFARLATQNWDSPVVVTTNVQLLESLFSSRPGKCRKLHNVANSVLILDEAQAVPDRLLKVTLAMLEELVADYGVTVLLSTATQPAFDGLWPFESEVSQVVSDRAALSRDLGQRVRYQIDGALSSDELVDRLAACEQALCIVGTKREARLVYRALADRLHEGPLDGAESDGIYHLSANMTPVHRQARLDRIRARLSQGERCLVVSTSLVEAGVDVDFPVVFREMAGLDSIVQAAGRCNREGLMPVGVVHVFDLDDRDADGEGQASRSSSVSWLSAMGDIGRNVLRQSGGRVDAESTRSFFQQRYAHSDLDETHLYAEMTSRSLAQAGFATLDFEAWASGYVLIDDDTRPVFVPWGDEGQALLDELGRLRAAGCELGGMALRLQRSSIGVFGPQFGDLVSAGAIDDKTYAPIAVLDLQTGCRETYRDDVGFVGLEGDVVDLIV